LAALRKALAALLALGLLLALAGPADARFSRKKAIWGPTQVNGVSQFPIYHDLGAGIYEMHLNWRSVARTRPRHPSDPADPAYRWPADVDYAIAEARKYRMRVALLLIGTPRWANGGRGAEWAPKRARDFALFARAAARRYRRVRLWMIWGEPSRKANFRPLPRFECTGPRRYARMLDAAYVQLKRQNRRNLVIGGNTFTTGDIAPRQFIKCMAYRHKTRPRLDMYGHNPFTRRRPNLRKRPLGFGYADFSDLDTLARWVDRYLGRRHKRRIKLFLSEFTIPSDHKNYEFNFWVDRATQARWLRSALRITRHWSRIYALGWLSLYDEAPTPDGLSVNRGLLDYRGRKKPSYNAYRIG
jgi:hypothetical protein